MRDVITTILNEMTKALDDENEDAYQTALAKLGVEMKKTWPPFADDFVYPKEKKFQKERPYVYK